MHDEPVRRSRSGRLTTVRVGLAGLSVLFVALLVARHQDLSSVLDAVRRGRPGWLLLALLIESLWFVNQTALYQSLYRLLCLPASPRQLLTVVLASNFVNFATPTASLGAVPLFLADADQRGLDRSRVVLINILRLTFSLIVLDRDHKLHFYELIAGAILLAAAALVVVGLLVAAWRPQLLGRLLGGASRRLDQVMRRGAHRAVLDADRASQFGLRLGQSARAIRYGGRRLLRPWVHAVVTDGLQLLILGATLRAFPGTGNLGIVPLVVVFTIGVLFSNVALTPQGVGSAEAASIAALMSFGVPIGRAAAVVLAYRGLTFWLPFLVGFLALHRLPNLRGERAAPRMARPE